MPALAARYSSRLLTSPYGGMGVSHGSRAFMQSYWRPLRMMSLVSTEKRYASSVLMMVSASVAIGALRKCSSDAILRSVRKVHTQRTPLAISPGSRLTK